MKFQKLRPGTEREPNRTGMPGPRAPDQKDRPAVLACTVLGEDIPRERTSNVNLTRPFGARQGEQISCFVLRPANFGKKTMDKQIVDPETILVERVESGWAIFDPDGREWFRFAGV